MILPTKHTKLAESLLGFSSVLIAFLHTPRNVDELWNDFNNSNKNQRLLPAYQNFDQLILALDFLFLLNAVSLNSEGKLELCV